MVINCYLLYTSNKERGIIFKYTLNDSKYNKSAVYFRFNSRIGIHELSR